MEIKDKIMYHYHKVGIHDEKWEVGNELVIDNDFISYYSEVLNEFNTSVPTTDGELESFDKIIKYYLKDENFDKIDRELAKRMMTTARRIIMGANVFKRELALEECRKQFYPELPSRLHSIWVAEEKQLPFWKEQFNENDTELFELELNGNLFKSSDKFLPNDYLRMHEINEQSKKYWDPKFETEEEDNKAEYLFQGKVKILKKVNKKP